MEHAANEIILDSVRDVSGEATSGSEGVRDIGTFRSWEDYLLDIAGRKTDAVWWKHLIDGIAQIYISPETSVRLCHAGRNPRTMPHRNGGSFIFSST